MSCSSGKIRYRSQLHAHRAISQIHRRGAGPARSYRCEECGAWHISRDMRKTKRKWAA